MTKIFLTTVMLLCLINIGKAQNAQSSWTLQSPESGNKTYIARDYVSLKPGFSYTASSGNSFNATVNPCLLFSSLENAYIKPDGSTTNNSSEGSAVGKIPGSIDVNPSGAITYTIPIACPPGINGMQPNLSLTYNSQSGNGIAGWGWNIGGLSMISRVAKNYYYDGEKTGMIWDKNSPFALDGQRLVLNGISVTSADTVEYRTENDESNKIVGYNMTSWGPQYFKVYQKNGNVLEYGCVSTPASYFPIKSSSSSVPLSGFYNLGWALYKITDPNKNFIQFNYETTPVADQSGYYSYQNTRIASIDYGHDENHNKGFVATINFEYGKNTSIPTSYIDGMEIINQNYLNRITVKGANSTLELYNLLYTIEEGNYYLKSVKKTAANGESFLPIEFAWSTKSYTQELSSKMTLEASKKYTELNNQGYVIQYMQKHWGDINGDGVLDPLAKIRMAKGSDMKNFWVMYRNGGNNWFYQTLETEFDRTTHNSFLFADNDNDGRDELYIGEAKVSPNYTLACYKYQNSQFSATVSSDINIRLSGTDFNKKSELFAISGDFLGNGSTQFLAAVNKNQICGFSVDGVNISALAGNHDRIYLTDINGNGKLELMCITGSTTVFYEYDKTYNSFVNIYSFGGFGYKDKIYVGDFNGDGNTDILRLEYAIKVGLYRSWHIWTSNGTSLFDTGKVNGLTSSKAEVILMDVNQDGKTDILQEYLNFVNNVASDGTMVLLLSSGDGFTPVLQSIAKSEDLYFSAYGKFEPGLNKSVFIESGWNVNSCISPRYYSFCKDVKFNKITRIKNAYEDEYVLNYKSAKSPFNNGSSITVTDPSTSTSPNNISNVLPPEFEVASQITGPLFNQQYTFDTPLIHKQGKGFFGFKNVQVRDNIKGLVTVNENNINTEYYITYPKSTLLKTTTGSSISREDNVYNFIKQQKAFFLRLESQTSTDYLTNRTVVKQFSQYDDSNNPQTVSINYGNGFREIQNIEYDKKGSWCYNKVKKVTTTKSCSGTSDHIRVQEYSYDSKGNLLTEKSDPNTSFQKTTTYSNYDKYGNPKLITLSAGSESRSVSMAYSPMGRFVTSKTNNLLNETVNYIYDENRALLLSETSRLGTTSYQYDGFGRLQKTIGPDKTESFKLLKWAVGSGPSGGKYYEYSETSGGSPVTVWHDNKDRKLRQRYYGLNGKEIYIDTEYNSKNQLYRASEPYYSGETPVWAATNYYDVYGRLQSYVTPMGTTSYSYSNLMTTVTSPNTVTITEKNVLGGTVSQTTNGKKVSYTYYASGAVKTATPEGSESINMEYDLTGNRTKLSDPDAGTITSVYDVWGQLKSESQSIHINQSPLVTNYIYLKGLLSKKSCNGETTNYSYDSNNRLTEIYISNKHSQQFQYDSFDRVIKTIENVKNEKQFITETSYDPFGRIKKEIYPSGYFITNSYDSYGNLTSVTDAHNNLCWQAMTSNARGQLTKTKRGNLEQTFLYDSRGLPSSTTASGVINLSYSFNNKLNLIARSDLYTNQREDFAYDNMNRLTSWTVFKNGTAQKYFNLNYDPTVGTVTTKSDVGYTFGYGEGNAGPHALSSISGKPDLIPSFTQKVTYTNFKKVSGINERNKSLSLDYGVDEQRRKGIFRNGSHSFTRYYQGNYEEEVSSSGNIRKIHYVSGGNGLACIYINNAGRDTLLHAYSDYQGSLLALADANGIVKERYAYDPWGNRRNPSDWQSVDERSHYMVDRGYTLHEHLDLLGLINMNGRVYDPLLGMFLSPDPYVQAPGNWLNYNRYGYCYGNPMSYTDPSGEFILAAVVIGAFVNAAVQGFSGNLHGGVGSFFKATGIGALSGAAGAGAGSILGGAGFAVGAINGAMGGFAGGMVSGAGNAWVNGASFGQGLKTGAISGGLGAAGGALIGGVSSGVTAARNGGNFWSGKGTTFVNEMIASAEDELGGEYFRDNKSMQEYIKSENGWEPGKFGIDNIDVENEFPINGKYFRSAYDGVILREQADGSYCSIGGLRQDVQTSLFKRSSAIYMSPHQTVKTFTATLNHEFIHAYHYSLGLKQILGSYYRNFTENSAYTYSYYYGNSANALQGLQSFPYVGPFNKFLWPSYLIPLK